MKVTKITEAKQKFTGYKILIEISVESEKDKELLYILKSVATDLYLGDEDGNAISSLGSISINNEAEANDLIQNILSNL